MSNQHDNEQKSIGEPKHIFDAAVKANRDFLDATFELSSEEGERIVEKELASVKKIQDDEFTEQLSGLPPVPTHEIQINPKPPVTTQAVQKKDDEKGTLAAKMRAVKTATEAVAVAHLKATKALEKIHRYQELSKRFPDVVKYKRRLEGAKNIYEVARTELQTRLADLTAATAQLEASRKPAQAVSAPLPSGKSENKVADKAPQQPAAASKKPKSSSFWDNLQKFKEFILGTPEADSGKDKGAKKEKESVTSKSKSVS